MPDVVAQRRADAERRLRAAGFFFEIALEATSSLPEGKVISQDPAAGEFAVRGSTVKIVVARPSAAQGVEVPRVVGRTRAMAESILRDEGFRVRVRMSTSSGREIGRVLDQAPRSGDRANAGTLVEIVVGTSAATGRRGANPEEAPIRPDASGGVTSPADSGRLRRPPGVPAGGTTTYPPSTPKRDEPATGARMPKPGAKADRQAPSLQGTEVRKAIETALRQGLIPIVDLKPGEGTPNHVLNQHPAAGTAAKAGDSIRLRVVLPAGSPTNVYVPLVLGADVEKARRQLMSSGAVVNVVELSVPGHPYAGTRRVAAQYPSGRMGRGQAGTVTIWVIK